MNYYDQWKVGSSFWFHFQSTDISEMRKIRIKKDKYKNKEDFKEMIYNQERIMSFNCSSDQLKSLLYNIKYYVPPSVLNILINILVHSRGPWAIKILLVNFKSHCERGERHLYKIEKRGQSNILSRSSAAYNNLLIFKFG